MRTIMGKQTLFSGVYAVEPGQSLTFDLDHPCSKPRESRIDISSLPAEPDDTALRSIVEDAVQSHLRSDVELCAMLSGGLDSTIIAGTARQNVASLRTYCSGVDANEGDPSHASDVAALFGTEHTTALLDEATFSSLWVDTVSRTGMPLATPNEVAIRLIARTLRENQQIVALSGEGADELFAGYDAPLTDASERKVISGGRHELNANAWIPHEIKSTLLVGAFAVEASDDLRLVALFESAFERANAGVSDEGVAAHLRFQRSVNLPMLLHRLDAATMLESVEGRTPFADVRVAEAAGAIPIKRLLDVTGTSPATRTKLALRKAFQDRVPSQVLSREKASFPLPFERWMGRVASKAQSSAVGGTIVQPALLAAIAEDPSKHWHLAWPVFNIVLWAEHWWGHGLDDFLRDLQDQANAVSMRGTAPSNRLV
ncbi:MAG: asparagine synthase C-terminal domain-containing protein [Cyanobacteria bacterium P01_A01_bin.68]